MATSFIKWQIIGSLFVGMYASLTTINQTIVKGSGLTIAQCVLGRYATQFICATLWWNIKKPQKPYLFDSLNNNTTTIIHNWYGDKPYILNIWGRGFLYGLNSLFHYVSIILLPIGDAQCILFQAPLIAVYIGAIWLKESLPSFYILIPSTTMVICGIVLMSQPVFVLQIFTEKDNNKNYESLNIYGILAATVSAICWSFSSLLIRKAKDSHLLQIEFASSGCLCFVLLPISLVINHYIFHIPYFGNLYFFDKNEWSFNIYAILIMITIGICGFAQLCCNVTGYQLGKATYVSWLEYITIPTAFIYQTIFFDDFPNKYEIVGGILVTAGCLLPLIQQLYVYYTHKNRIRFSRLQNISSTDDDL
eukprot:209191_1